MNTLLKIAESKEIVFVTGKRKHKPEIQQIYEELEVCADKLLQYKECFEIMGKDRNSYSKTDWKLDSKYTFSVNDLSKIKSYPERRRDYRILDYEK